MPPRHDARKIVRSDHRRGTEPARVQAGAIAAAVVVAIVAFAAGRSSAGGSSPVSASGNGFVLRAPADWKAANADLVPALGDDAVALAPPGVAAGEGVVAGIVPSAEAAALTRRRAGEPARVKLGAGEAVMFADARGGATLYVLPTSAGTLVVSCSSADVVREACAEVAGSVELTRGEARAPGPSDEGARAIHGALTRLGDRLDSPSEDLSGARSASDQAAAAGDIARHYRTAAREVRAASVGALATGARDGLAGALNAVGGGWTRYARAARALSSAGVASARAAISRARARVVRARAALGAAGYPPSGG